jgi:hypothetical protein
MARRLAQMDYSGKMRKIRIGKNLNIVWLTIALVSLATSIAAHINYRATERQTGKVAGDVFDAANQKLAKVKLTFENVRGSATHQVTSDDTGHYEIEIPAGTYLVSAEMQGYRPPKPIELQVRSGKNVELDLRFPPIYTNDDPPAVAPGKANISQKEKAFDT